MFLKGGGGLLREAFVEVLDDPDGQIESVLPLSREKILPQPNPQKKKETLLARADEIECLNFRFATESLTNGESLLCLFLLTCDRGDCEELICNRGCYKAVSPNCRKVLDGGEMFMLQIDLLKPLNLPCAKCFDKSNMGSKVYYRKSSLKHSEEDLQANDLIICEKHLRSKITRRTEESDRCTCVNRLKGAESQRIPNKVPRTKDSADLRESFS